MRLTKALNLDNDGNLVKTAPQNAGSERIETVRMPLSELPAFMALPTTVATLRVQAYY